MNDSLRGAREERGEGRGLYRSEYEHDSCGIGFVADIRGRPSHDIVERALEALERMAHRGAEGADNKTGDGAGILMQIPRDFYRTLLPELDGAGGYGTGLLFAPKDAALCRRCTDIAEAMARRYGFTRVHWRDVPAGANATGVIARGAEPAVKQLFLIPEPGGGEAAGEGAANGWPGAGLDGGERLELTLYIIRKRFEAAVRADPELRDAHFSSLSSRTVVYKGMLMPAQLRRYYPDLSRPEVASAAALVHSRFSTNTFPAWHLAQPFRMIAHNGEINTIKGNRFWAAARESLYRSDVLGEELAAVLPVVEPDKSDSAGFDNMLEFLTLTGRSLPEALMTLIPEAWNDKNPISDEVKAFYEYNACAMEPWDGPASVVFFDGRYAGGTLDRNGLRPSRYTITKDGLIVMASETGVQDFEPGEVASKGRLMPGKLLLVDLAEGRVIPDAEVKASVSRRLPYMEWIRKNGRTLPQESAPALAAHAVYTPDVFNDDRALLFMQRVAGYSREDRDKLLAPMMSSGGEPTNSMGTDTPAAVFSDVPQRPFAYFKQMFAQVTNPPIDSIREDLVMTLTGFVGPQGNLLEKTPERCRRIKVKNPIVMPDELAALITLAESGMGFKTARIEAVFTPDPDMGAYAARGHALLAREPQAIPRAIGPRRLKPALDGLVDQACRAVKDGAGILVLSDAAALDPSSRRCPVPSLLALGAVHHGLSRAGLRMKTSLAVESAEPREIMHFALLFGYGADLVCPYGALASIAGICRDSAGAPENEPPDYAVSVKRYLKGMQKALLKVMAKMGVSTLRSYRGAQIFEALGLGRRVVETCFPGTASRIAGVSFIELEEEISATYVAAARRDVAARRGGGGPDTGLLFRTGQYSWRKDGERHAWNPDTIRLLQRAVRENDYARFKEFSAACDALNKSPQVIRGLLDIKAGGAPLALSEVEDAAAIMKRFTTGAMSFGSISKEAHETIARALNSIAGRSNSGEGGEDPARFAAAADGSSTRSAIKQVASGRFGVTSEYLANCVELQIKMAQGAKPGEGGQLPGHKVDAAIGRVRHSTPGVTLISPPPHHDIYSIEDLAQLIFDLKNANREARVSVKLVSEAGVGTIAAGVAKAHADNILISGYDGGTGASPQSSIRHAGIPWELGLSETHQTLLANGLRGRVRLQTDGQLKTGRDVVIAGLLGAEEFGFGTAALVVLGCVMMRKCHENTCPAGIATQDERLRARFAGKSEHLVGYFRFLAEEVREIMAGMGMRTFDELVGRSDLLVQTPSPKLKSAGVDLSAIIRKTEGPTHIPGGWERYCAQDQIHRIDAIADRELIEKCRAALDDKKPVSLKRAVRNTDRAAGAMLSYEVSKRYGGAGLPENTIRVDWHGSAGQSFGAFLAPGISFRLAGDANDYLGKGLSGGQIAVFPPPGSTFASQENIIVGNTALYGATSGELYAAGLAGERFCVRNSGALAVVEGSGDHCAEYMTGGRLVVLGRVGRNFAAGMSGGIAYVLDRAGDFEYFLNKGMVEWEKVEAPEDFAFIEEAVRRHVKHTFSGYASSILDNWDAEKRLFVKIIPVEYRKVLAAAKEKR